MHETAGSYTRNEMSKLGAEVIFHSAQSQKFAFLNNRCEC